MSEVIVALTPNHIGDVLFTEPALAALKAGYPTNRLIVFTSPTAYAVLEHHPDIDEIRTRKRKCLKSWWQLVCQLRYLHPTVIVDFSPSSMGLALSAWLSGTPHRFGFAFRPLLSWLFTTALPLCPERHFADDHLALAEAAGGKTVRRIPRIFLQSDEREWGRQWLREQGWDEETPLLGCHPFSSVARKEWELSKFAILLQWAQESLACLPVIFGSATDQIAAEQLAVTISTTSNAKPATRKVLVAAGKLTLRQFIAVADWCIGFIGGDSGPVHIAAALGVPTLALFGPTNSNRTGPLGERVMIVRSPTGRMDDLSVVTVREALHQLCASSLNQ